MAKHRESRTITVMLAVLEAPLAVGIAYTVNTVNADPYRWATSAPRIPLAPWAALTILTVAAAVVAVTVIIRGWRQFAPEPPADAAHTGPTFTTTDNARVDLRGATFNQTAIPVPTATEPDNVQGIHNLPAQSAVFVGRDLTRLDRAFATKIGVIGQAVRGLGGIGKTELALHYAHSRGDRYPLRWWITADTPDNITLGLAALTERLHTMPSLANARAWALTYLQSHPGWLLILDNVEETEHIAELLGQLGDRGDILITTRRDLGHARWTELGLAPVVLDTLDRPDSVKLLHALTGAEFQPNPRSNSPTRWATCHWPWNKPPHTSHKTRALDLSGT